MPFRIIKTSTLTIQVEERSSIRIAKSGYTPLGSDVALGRGEASTDQDLVISSRSFMTEAQKEAEEASISYATSAGIEITENIIDQKFNQESQAEARTAPYQAFHIKGLGQDFTPKWDDDPQKRDYIYLELDLHASLDIRSATIVCGPVNGNGLGFIPGEEGDRTDFDSEDKNLIGWPSFPSSYLFNFKLDEEGELIYLPTGQPPTEEELNIEKFQRKAYLLIGFLSKDILTDKESIILFDEKSKDQIYMYIVGCVNDNLEVSHGLHNELPVVNLVPTSKPGQLSSNYFSTTESGGDGGDEG